MASVRGGQTLEGVTIVRAATCLVGRGRKVQVHRVSGEPSSEATPLAEGRSGGGGGESRCIYRVKEKSFGAGEPREETPGEFRGTVFQGKELSDSRWEGP